MPGDKKLTGSEHCHCRGFAWRATTCLPCDGGTASACYRFAGSGTLLYGPRSCSRHSGSTTTRLRVRQDRDRSLAEDVAQDARAALVHCWRRQSPPDSSEAFTFAIAKRRAGRAAGRPSPSIL